MKRNFLGQAFSGENGKLSQTEKLLQARRSFKLNSVRQWRLVPQNSPLSFQF
jgi:hypothetical protein